MASVAYYLITTKVAITDGKADINSVSQDQFFQAVSGNTPGLRNIYSRDKSSLDKFNENKCSVLYLAARGGFFDTCRYILSIGANVNQRQGAGSTALHVAAYYGHKYVVELLLRCGADMSITNDNGDRPIAYADNERVKQLILEVKASKLNTFAYDVVNKGLTCGVRFIYHPENKNEIIAREFVRAQSVVDITTVVTLNKILTSWKPAWHGTSFNNLSSIIKKGLLPAGTGGIAPPDGHIPLGMSALGIEDWAAAVFVSPSILYASHNVYAERILAEGDKWCCLVKVYCEKGHYTKHQSTVSGFEMDPDTDENLPEYRIPTPANENVFLRVEKARHVIVYSVMFVKLTFLESVSKGQLNSRDAQSALLNDKNL